MEGQCKPVRGEKQGVMWKRGAQRGCWEEGVDKVGVQRGICRWHRERCWPTRPPEMEVRPQKAAHPIWNYFQKLTDLSANPDMSRTAPESSFQLCMPGWSRVPAEKMLSEKIPGSELGKQRQTHNRDSQGGWMRGNHCLLGSVVTRPAKGNPLCDPHSYSHQAWL